jgi:DNA-binding transcriptional LysR family regulator
MDPRRLTTFLTVRKHRNFTRAAKELELSQPAVSRQIQQLERELGVPVFDRMGKALHVTDAGETLAKQAQKALLGLEGVVEAVRRHAWPGTGRLRIGAGTTPGLYLLPQVIGKFRTKHPHVSLSYVVERSGAIVEKVLRNEIDVGFIGSPVDDRAVAVEPIAEDRIICLANRRHPAGSRRTVDIGALVDETWIVRPPGSATRAMFDAWLAGTKCTLGDTIEIGCPEGVRALVKAGVGLSYMSIHAAALELRRKQLVSLKVKGLPLKRTLWAVRHVDKRATPSVQEFMRLLRENTRW